MTCEPQKYAVTTPPVGSVLPLSVVKKHLRVDDVVAGAKPFVALGAGDSQLVITSKYDGTEAHSLGVEVIEAGISTPLSVAFTNQTFTITSATDGAGAPTSTVNDVIAALYRNVDFISRFTGAAGAGAGTGILAASALTLLSGGINGSSDDDDLITFLIEAATIHTENICNKKLLTQSMTLFGNSFSSPIKITWGPVQSITHLKYFNSEASQITFDVSRYQLDQYAMPAELRLAPTDQSWPSVQRGRVNAVEIEFVTGYGTADDVPKTILQGMKFLLGHWYTNRENIQIGAGILALEVPDTYSALIANDRDYYF